MNGDIQQDSDSEEKIIVTRQEEERDPEAEAEFDRELQKVMSESLESRKFDRKPVFDVPLPMRRLQRLQTAGSDGSENESAIIPPTAKTMAFSLMTKKGSKQQVSQPTRQQSSIQFTLTLLQTRTIEMPSDSQFAVAMKTQREAEREEQQRIKNHILNLDLQDSSADNSGTTHDLSFDSFPSPNPKFSVGRIWQSPKSPLVPHLNMHAFAHSGDCQGTGASEKHLQNPSLGRTSSTNPAKSADKSSSSRRGDRARKLQLSDVDWYDQ